MSPVSNTVFVLGAGFSVEQRYPLARDMRERTRRTSLPSASTAPVSSEAMPSSESRVSRRATAARNEGAAFAARRSSFASSLASLSLRRHDLKRDFHEPASLQAATSAQRNSSQRASAASARARCCSYRDFKSCGVPASGDLGGDQIPAPSSVSVASTEKSSSRTAMRSTIAQVKSCYQPPCGISIRCGRRFRWGISTA